MAVQNGKSQAAGALDLISAAFSNRAPPSALSTSKQLLDFEYEEVMSYDGMRWQDVTFAHIERYPDAVFWFSPEAFCYFLPGLLSAGPKENRWDANSYDSIIGMLDRSPEPDYWDDFFSPRWSLFTAAEINAVAAWASWLELVQPDAFHSNTYERVQDTLTLLREER